MIKKIFGKLTKILGTVIAALLFFAPSFKPSKVAAKAEEVISPNSQAANVYTEEEDMNEVIGTYGRSWQGAAPGIARTPKGRLFACLFSGGENEPQVENYVIFSYSDDDGETWIDPFMVVCHPDEHTRVFDPSLQVDPLGRLWLNWNQQYPMPDGRDFPYGWWRIRVDNPDAPIEQVKAQINAQTPQRITGGIRINKFIVLDNGEWMQPMALSGGPYIKYMVSSDQGDTWEMRGTVQKNTIGVYEPTVVQKKDGTLWSLIRLGVAQSALGPAGGVGQSFSSDGGESWSTVEEALPRPLIGASARLYFGRLKSGALLFITNDSETIRRVNLTAYLSYDDGETWPYSLVLDDRVGVGGSIIDGPSYPDCVQADDGRIYAVWDFGRYDEKEMRMSVFTEEDVKAGRMVSAEARDKVVVSKLGPYKDVTAVTTELPESFSVKKGTALADVTSRFPTQVQVLDEDGTSYTLEGNWAGKNYNPQEEGEYVFYYALSDTEGQKYLKDTHDLLSVRVTVEADKGCSATVSTTTIAVIGVAVLAMGTLLSVKSGRKKNER